ncbi:MAG: putative bifunctional diguanylate cyclase/phosphodiesterase, partial [Geminicoccaceae bacterium]
MGAAGSGAVWGLAGFLFYDPNSIVSQIYLPFVLAGMSAGSLVVQTGCMPAFTAFYLTAISPYALRLALEADAAHLSMTAALIAYMGGIGVLGRSINAYLMASVQLAAENEQLVTALRDKSDQLETTFQHIRQGVVVFSRDGQLIDWNVGHQQLHGYPPGLYERGADICEFSDLRIAIRSASDQTENGPSPEDQAGVHLRCEQAGANGRILEVECTPMPNGGFVSTSTDVTERKRAEQRLRESEERLALAVEAADAALIDGDLTRGVSYYNDKAQTMLGYRPGELATSMDDVIERVHPDDRVNVIAGVEAMRSGESDSFKSEHRQRTKAGGYLWISLALKVVARDHYDHVTRIVGIRFDISERKRTEERIVHMATHDALTDVPNRTMLADVLRSERNIVAHEGGHLAVLFVDLDNFKHVNDSLGHAAGDQLLKQVAARLKGCIRRSDVVARLGGDEFAVLATDCDDIERFDCMADRIIESIEAPFEIDGDTISIGASIGMAILQDHATDVGQLMIQADLALHEAKDAGRGQCRKFRAPMMERARAKHNLNAALRQAIENDEFELYFQPIVSLENFRPTAIECLLRWHDPTCGLRSPRDFIASIEGSSLALAVSDWVMQSAARHAVSWRSQDLQLPPLAVNMPTVMLEIEYAVERIATHFTETGLKPSDWIIEVTEGAFADGPKAIDTLKALRELGAKVAIDDFGTGYSSMARLGALPVDQLKIDQSFLREFGSIHRVHAVLRALNAL